MKKSFLFFFLALLAISFGFVPNASAQQSFASFQLGGPVTTVSVLNDTADSTPLRVEIGGKEDRDLLLRGGSWGRNFGVGTAANMALVVYACEATAEGGPTIQPPTWATLAESFGKNGVKIALTPDYLAANPSESDLKHRVAAIKKAIRDQLGHHQMDNALDDWFKTVKRMGLRPVGILCQDPQIVVQNVSVYQYGWQAQAITLLVRGDREHGYTTQLVQ